MFQKESKNRVEKNTYLITSPDKSMGKSILKKYTATLEQTSNILLLVKMLKQSM